ncbi:hypothetical protein BIW11_04704, partial [Tropilaelaps mercedesae]
RSLSLPTCPC